MCLHIQAASKAGHLVRSVVQALVRRLQAIVAALAPKGREVGVENRFYFDEVEKVWKLQGGETEQEKAQMEAIRFHTSRGLSSSLAPATTACDSSRGDWAGGALPPPPPMSGPVTQSRSGGVAGSTASLVHPVYAPQGMSTGSSGDPTAVQPPPMGLGRTAPRSSAAVAPPPAGPAIGGPAVLASPFGTASSSAAVAPPPLGPAIGGPAVLASPFGATGACPSSAAAPLASPFTTAQAQAMTPSPPPEMPLASPFAAAHAQAAVPPTALSSPFAATAPTSTAPFAAGAPGSGALVPSRCAAPEATASAEDELRAAMRTAVEAENFVEAQRLKEVIANMSTDRGAALTNFLHEADGVS